MRRLLRVLRFLSTILLYVATIAGAVFAMLPYIPQLKETIAHFAKWLLPLLALPFWFWPSIALVGAMVLLLLARRRKLNKFGSSAPLVLDRLKLRRKIQRNMKLGRYTKHCREIAGLYCLARRNPECSFVHGTSLLLIADPSPFVLFPVVDWLLQELTSSPHRPSYPLPILRILADTLCRQINKRHWRLLWPLKSQRRFRELLMDVYNSVAHYGVETLERNLFLHWQSRTFPDLSKDPQSKPLENDMQPSYREAWERELEAYRDAALDLLQTIANPIYEKWLNSSNTSIEVEKATLTQIIPTLFAVPVNLSCSDNQVSTVISTIQRLAEQIEAAIWIDYQESETKVWVRRLKLILETNVLVYLWRWLDADHRLAVLKKTFGELDLLYEEKCDPPVQINDLFAEFDQLLRQIYEQKKVKNVPCEFDKDKSDSFLQQVKSFSKRAKKDGALPIAIMCNSSISPKLKSILSSPTRSKSGKLGTAEQPTRPPSSG